jgi:coenzyme PQQ synthesis protein D (PqqD)
MTHQISEFNFTATPEAVASFHEDGIVILHTGKGCLFTANGTGARIWGGVTQQQSLDTIADEISSEYQITRTTVYEHMVAFLAELERNQLIKREAVS